jgi:hypothetical protein
VSLEVFVPLQRLACVQAIRLIADVVVANQQRLVKQQGLALNPGKQARRGDVHIF